MIGYCDFCKRDTEQAVIQNKRKQTRVYCAECKSILRPPTKADLEELRRAARLSKIFVNQYIR